MRRTILLLLILVQTPILAQESEMNPIFTHVPCLQINPDARICGFADIDMVAPSLYRDAGIYKNPSLLAQQERSFGLNFSYRPLSIRWYPNNKFLSLNAYIAFNTKNALSLRAHYFDQGRIRISSIAETNDDIHIPKDMFIQISYARKLMKGLSAGIGLKYFSSELDYSELDQIRYELQSIHSYAVDLGIAYSQQFAINDRVKFNFQTGGALSNFGPKTSYSTDPEATKLFIPIQLAAGMLGDIEVPILDKLNFNAALAYQVEKMLVPTPPIWDYDTNEIIGGYTSDITAFHALSRSFYDAPGGWKEELQEVLHKIGTEARFSYANKAYFAMRYGRFMEHNLKGNRKYHMLGLGVGVFGFTFDYCLLISSSPGLTSYSITAGYRSSLDNLFSF